MLRQVFALAGLEESLQLFYRRDRVDISDHTFPIVYNILRIEGAENIGRVFFDYTGGKPFTELLENPLIGERFKGFCLRGELCELVVFPGTEEDAHTDTLTMDAFSGFKARRVHFHQMRHQMLRTGGGAGMA